jgi:moderate conductance mechanosensitive channel
MCAFLVGSFESQPSCAGNLERNEVPLISAPPQERNPGVSVREAGQKGRPICQGLLNRAMRRAALFALVGVLAAVSVASAQVFPGFSFASSTSAAPGGVTSAPIVLDGQVLFTVSVAANAKDQLPIATRAGTINDVISQILATEYDPSTLRVIVERHGLDSVLAVVDARHRDPLTVVTVTNADAQASRTGADVLAGRWQEALQAALAHALLIRQPAARKRHLGETVTIAIVLAVLTIVGYVLVLTLGRRIDALVAEVEQHDRELAATRADPAPVGTPAVEAHHRHITAHSLRLLKPARRLALLRSLHSLLLWGMLLAWFGAGTWAAVQFPQTTPLGHEVWKSGFAIALIWISTALIDRVLAIVIVRLPSIWDLRSSANAEERTRHALRVPTIVRAVNDSKTVFLVFLAVLGTMTQVGIPVGSVVTIGGVAAIAVSLAAQNLIRDFVSGLLVLAEDQFVVGDFVTINGASGLVERLTLRMVQLRGVAGSLVTISHSASTSVVNHSRNWSGVDYAVSIDPGADVECAIALIRSTIEELRIDPAWKGTIVGSVGSIGVDALSRDGVIIRARIKTAPLRQFALQREMNFRISRAFGEAKIGFGAPVVADP